MQDLSCHSHIKIDNNITILTIELNQRTKNEKQKQSWKTETASL